MLTTRFIFRLTIYLLTWWVLTSGATDSWIIGVPAILSALYIDFRFFRSPGIRWSWGALLSFAFFFLKSSITSGLDVIRRIYHPRLPLMPAMIVYPLQLESSAAIILFVCTVSLLPGTLSTAIVGQKVVIHVLDLGRPFEQDLKIIENRVAAIFKQHQRCTFSDTRIE
jgi:multisubunit Na+/H+ antiporter MnhE subunit